MSGRFEWDGDYEAGHQNAAELFDTRARQAIYSKRGRAALRELREALMALPAHELIEGAVCRLVDDDEDVEPVEIATVPGQVALDGSVAIGPPVPAFHGAGVCAIGAWTWWRKVKAGADPVVAFRELPTMDAEEESSVMFETAWLGAANGLTFTLAWELASGNDETFEDMTPADRWRAFVAWIDKVLAMPPLRRGSIPPEFKRLGQSWAAGS